MGGAKMKYKEREKIPWWGTIIAVLVTVLILGVFPVIPLLFYINYNNKYAEVYKTGNEFELEQYENKINFCRNMIILVTLITVAIEIVVIINASLSIFEFLNSYVNDTCIQCNQ